MNGIHNDDDGFDPEQLRDLDKLMEQIISEDGLGFEMVFWISNRDAKDLIAMYDNYVITGKVDDPTPFINQCMIIASCLKDALDNDEDD